MFVYWCRLGKLSRIISKGLQGPCKRIKYIIYILIEIALSRLN